jgi:hypothetical protein
MKKFTMLLFSVLGVLVLSNVSPIVHSEELVNPQPRRTECLWEICSIDTMKLSRDKARQELNHPEFDNTIAQQMKLIKQTGANYVSVGTPYDKEFLPYLRRWVKAAREQDLNVYFRGNWSEWEGWFEYPKNLSPEQHIAKTVKFIEENAELFQSGDIFDPCPECENAGFWPQPAKDAAYREFVIKQQQAAQAAFQKINLNVAVRQSIIGGRAKEVLDPESLKQLGNQVQIDHYVPNPKGMSEYLDYFESIQTKTLVSEFGAPIPDMNGSMTEKQQADFIRSVLETMYRHNGSVDGLNYWVLSHGTTELVDESGKPRLAYEVIKEYFTPQIASGRIVDELDKPISGVKVKTSDGNQVLTDENGFYSLKFPIREMDLIIESDKFATQSAHIAKGDLGSTTRQNFTLKPTDPSLLYRLQLWWKETF